MTTQTLSDGSIVEYGSDGALLKETSPDGSVYTGFDAQGRPHHVRIPASAGQAATSADIAYSGGNTIYTYADHSVITYDASNHIISEKLADGTEYTQFDDAGKAHHINVPAQNGNSATSADISYANGDAVYHYADGTTVTYDGGGHILDEKTADGSHYSQFDSAGQAHHVDTPAHNGNPATSADISYANSDSVYRYSDGSTVTYDGDGKIVDEKTADGSHYTNFDGENHAHHADILAQNGNPATSADISYANGDTVYHYNDGSTVTYDGSGKIVDEKTADGSDYTRFDADNHAHHVDVPAQNGNPAMSADISYANGDTVYHYNDGTTVTYDGGGKLVDEKTADGSDYTRFDADGKAHHVDIPAQNGNPATSADISYQGPNSVYAYKDGSTATYDANGNVVDQKTADGSDYTRFDADGKAHHVDIPAQNGNPATSADISYQGPNSVYAYKDGSTATYDANGNVVDQKTADGSDYTNFDADGKAHHVDIPAQNGNPATSADISYANGDTVYHYKDGSTVTYDGGGGKILDQKTADGSDYTNFDGNGQAHHVEMPAQNGNPATSADITYQNGEVVYHYKDGSTVTHDGSGNILDERAADGSDYTKFDADGKAHHVDIPAQNGNPATSADISYANGDTIYTYPDKSTVTYDGGGKIVDEKTADGSDYTKFDANGQAHHVDIPAQNGNPATSADISYQNGDAVYAYKDGSTVTYDGKGNILDEKTADGSDYTQFDSNGQAHHVDIPAQNGNPATSAEISYQGSDAVYAYKDGSTVTYDGKGNILDEKTADGSDYTQFDSNGKAHHVDIPAQNGNPATSADITYQNGDSVYTYADKTVVTYNDKGNILDEKTADGSDYTQFDADGKAHHVDIPAQNGNPATSAEIAYDNAYTYYTFADKTKLKYQSSNNALISETMPDGSTYTQFDGNQKPHHVDVPAYNGKPATSADISYADGKVNYRYADGTVATYDQASNKLLTQTSPDGAVYSDFSDDKPHHVEIPPLNGNPATSADISYADGNTIYRYADKSIVTYGPDGKTILTEQMPDGTTYSDFTGNKPGHVEIPPLNGNPPTSADITYADGNTVYTYKDHTVITYGPDGKTILTEKMPDGTVFSNFTGDKPGHVEIPPLNGNPPTSADITYDQGTGDTLYHYKDGSVVTYGPDGKTILTERMPDGTVYSDFQGGDKPHHVQIPPQNGKPATSADITYADGQATYHYPDGTLVVFDEKSGTVVKQIMPDGWTITYADGKPSSGVNSKTGQTVTITPDGKGGSIWTYSNGGPVIWEDKDGHPYKEVANGWTFTTFNSDGQPTDGWMKNPDGTITTVHVDYNIDGAGDNKWIYTSFDKDGKPTTTTVITNADGTPIAQSGHDGKIYSYTVLMEELLTAIHKVSAERDNINNGMRAIHQKFTDIHDTLWTGPSSDHFYSHIEDFMSLSKGVATVLSESIQRMEQSYNHYVEAEKSVFTSLTPITVESPPTFTATGELVNRTNHPGNLNLGPGPVVN